MLLVRGGREEVAEERNPPELHPEEEDQTKRKKNGTNEKNDGKTSTRTNRKTIIVPEHHPLFNLGTLEQDGFEVIKNYIKDYTIDLMLRLYVDRLIEKLNNKV